MRDDGVIRAYREDVTSATTPTTGSAEPQWPQATYASLRLLGTAALAFVVISTFRSHPSPGGQGAALGVSIALTTLCAASVTAVLVARARPAVQLAVYLTVVASAAALIGLQGDGAAFLGVFPAVSVAALMLPPPLRWVVALAAIVAVPAAWEARGRMAVSGIILNDFGVLAFYVLSLFARRLRDSNSRAEALLAELEQTRAAQALAAALAERQRLAREMHDVLAHSLSGLVLNLESARLLAEHRGTDPQVQDALDRAHRLARTGLDEARGAISMLRGDALPGPERLSTLGAEFERDTGIACTVTMTGTERDLGADGRLTFYRVAQEALTNVRRHAHADRVEVRLAYTSAGTRLTIEDFDAAGHLKPAPDGTGYGLTGMAERAELLGGTLAAGATDGGFLVDFWVPA